MNPRSPRSTYPRRAATGAALIALLVALGGCGPREDEPRENARPRVAIIGWDGASWSVIDPLLAEGRLPHLAALLETGSRGVLLAEPPLLSPPLWTTLATGFPSSGHGVTHFVLPDPAGRDSAEPILAATFHRRKAPLWRIASREDRSVGIVGWWVTWPAEPVRGYMVSDHLAYNRWDDWASRGPGNGGHLAYPPELVEDLEPVRVPPAAVSPEELTELVPFDEREQREMMQASRPIIFHAPSVFRFGYATDAANRAFAGHLLDTRPQPDLFAMVFVLTDVAGHVFWHHYEPEGVVGGEGLGRLREAIPNVYERIDEWTGEILARLDRDTTVLVISDHGMHGSGRVPEPGHNPAGDHAPEGILVVSGPEAPRGVDLGTVPALDFAPSVLHLLGLPVGRDMPGRVRQDWRARGPKRDIVWTGTHGDGRDATFRPTESPADDAYRERLRALGYIE